MESRLFKYNTRRHVKIWLGPLNSENQLRLMNTRAINPDSVLHLIYDSRLLKHKDLQAIQNLCRKQHIILLDVLNHIIPECDSMEEQHLISAYHDAILETKKGGNYAAASDILRWLVPVIKRGAYSDLDVLIDTRHVPEIIEIDKPLLLNIGSFNFYAMETVSVNNDIIIVADIDAALPLIKKVQRAIHEGCKAYPENKSAFDYYNEMQNINLDKNYDYPFNVILQNFIPRPHHDLDDFARGKSVVQAREEIIKQTESNSVYCNNTSGCDFTKGIWGSILSDNLREELITELRGEKRLALLKDSVIFSSGPASGFALFSRFMFDPAHFKEEVVPYALKHYGLEKMFPSKNNIPLHANGWTYIPETAQRNDFSWLSSGKALIADRELKIAQKAAEYECEFNSPRLHSNQTLSAAISTLLLANYNALMVSEMTRLAKLHVKQIETAKYQFSMNSICDHDKPILFSTCSEVKGLQVCVHTQVTFAVPSLFATFSPGSTEYNCISFADGIPGQQCFGSRIEESCSPGPSFGYTLFSAASYSALVAAVPEALGDMLKLKGYMSDKNADYVVKATNLLFTAYTGSWFAVSVGSGVTLGLEASGFNHSKARIIGNTLSCAITLGQNLTPTGLATTGVSYLAGRFGLWAEKQLVKKFEPSPQVGLRLK